MLLPENTFERQGDKIICVDPVVLAEQILDEKKISSKVEIRKHRAGSGKSLTAVTAETKASLLFLQRFRPDLENLQFLRDELNRKGLNSGMPSMLQLLSVNYFINPADKDFFLYFNDLPVNTAYFSRIDFLREIHNDPIFSEDKDRMMVYELYLTERFRPEEKKLLLFLINTFKVNANHAIIFIQKIIAEHRNIDFEIMQQQRRIISSSVNSRFVPKIPEEQINSEKREFEKRKLQLGEILVFLMDPSLLKKIKEYNEDPSKKSFIADLINRKIFNKKSLENIALLENNQLLDIKYINILFEEDTGFENRIAACADLNFLISELSRKNILTKENLDKIFPFQSKASYHFVRIICSLSEARILNQSNFDCSNKNHELLADILWLTGSNLSQETFDSIMKFSASELIILKKEILSNEGAEHQITKENFLPILDSVKPLSLSPETRAAILTELQSYLNSLDVGADRKKGRRESTISRVVSDLRKPKPIIKPVISDADEKELLNSTGLEDSTKGNEIVKTIKATIAFLNDPSGNPLPLLSVPPVSLGDSRHAMFGAGGAAPVTAGPLVQSRSNDSQGK